MIVWATDTHTHKLAMMDETKTHLTLLFGTFSPYILIYAILSCVCFFFVSLILFVVGWVRPYECGATFDGFDFCVSLLSPLPISHLNHHCRFRVVKTDGFLNPNSVLCGGCLFVE